MSITENHVKERLCVAHIEAVVGAAGVNLTTPRCHDYGIDGTLLPVVLRDNRRVESGFKVDFQAKSTTDWEHEGSNVVYDLEAKTYNDLVTRDPVLPRCVLFLLCLPKDAAHWMAVIEDGLQLRHCCYWTFLEGPATTNTSTKRINIPRSNILTRDAVHAILSNERARLMAAA